jgi:4-aminobutyrate aminotransferase-like enzyme
MDAWPPSEGEAIHTSTFLGHPLACATATAVLDALEGDDAYSSAERIGVAFVEGLRARLAGVSRVAEVRGLGLLVGVELVGPDGSSPATGLAARVAERALSEGVFVLPAGDAGHVVELTPPLTLTTEQVRHVVDVLSQVIQDA